MRSFLEKPLARGLGLALGIIGTTNLFFYLIAQSFEFGEGLEVATVALPLLAFGSLLVLHWRNRFALFRWFLLDFSIASMITFLVMHFVVAKHIL